MGVDPCIRTHLFLARIAIPRGMAIRATNRLGANTQIDFSYHISVVNRSYFRHIIIAMSTPPSQYDFLDLPDFSVEFGMDIDFGVDFGFGADFTTFDSATNDSGSYQYDDFPVSFLLMDMCCPHVIGAAGTDGPIDNIVFEALRHRAGIFIS